jgi:hypothetical protein
MNYVKQFIGKIVTVIAGPINRNFREEAQLNGTPERYPMNLLDHFMGRCVYADSQSIVIQHPFIGTQTWFNLNQVVCIAEEQELDPENPEHAEAIKSYKKTIEQRQQQVDASQPAPQPMQATADVRRIACPNCGRGSRIPPGLEDGSDVECPLCQTEFVYKESEVKSQVPANFVDIDSLQNMANESKS